MESDIGTIYKLQLMSGLKFTGRMRMRNREDGEYMGLVWLKNKETKGYILNGFIYRHLNLNFFQRVWEKISG